MKNKRLKGLGALLLLALTLSTLILVPLAAARELQAPSQQEIGTNLLVNPGFEGIGRPMDNSSPNYNNWTRDTFTGVQYGEIYTPEGWVTWWQEGDYGRPECHVIPKEADFLTPVLRIYSGYYTVKCFTFFRRQNAGHFQVVRNISPGTVVEASYYAHAWSCDADSSDALSCGDPYAFYFRVGIDPTGGTDPYSANIVWSSPYYHYDKFGLVGPVQATVGASGAVTFFTNYYAKWEYKHNDAYADHMVLKVVSQGETPTPTNEPPPPTSEAQPTAVVPQSTPTPRPDGSVVHIVEAGDTMFGLAIQYGVDLDELRRLNEGTVVDDFLSIGQEVIISGSPLAASTATPEPQPETPAETEPAQTPDAGTGGELPAAPAGDTASLCVLAYFDANNDMFRQADAGEMALPNAEITLVGMSGPAGTYTTDGISEPYCFQNLEPGNYILRHTPPSGYKLTDTGQWNIPLSAGQVSSLNLGYARDEGANAETGTEQESPGTPQATESADETEQPGGITKVLNTVLRITGIIVLVLAIAVGVLFFLSRRAM
jgi:LysM repeat protein